MRLAVPVTIIKIVVVGSICVQLAVIEGAKTNTNAKDFTDCEKSPLSWPWSIFMTNGKRCTKIGGQHTGSQTQGQDRSSLAKVQHPGIQARALMDKRLWFAVAVIELVYSFINAIDGISGIIEKTGVLYDYITEPIEDSPDTVTVLMRVKMVFEKIFKVMTSMTDS